MKMNQKKPEKTLKQKLRYKMDLWMSKGSRSMILLLFEASFLIILILGLLEWIIQRSTGESFLHSVWVVTMHALDPGAIAGDTDYSKLFLFLMLLATFTGLFFLALLIGFINDAIQNKMNELAEGREAVIETGHTVILGFSEATFIILDELIEASANQGKKRNAVVVMGEFPKQEMEEKLRMQFSSFGNLEIVCRSGSIYNFNDLNRCSILTSKAIIVCADRDFETIKAIVACTNLLNEKGGQSKNYLTAVINHKKNELAARIAGRDTGDGSGSALRNATDRLELLMMETTIARIMTHTCRQAGLSKVYVELFSFSGSELYIIRNEAEEKKFFDSMTGKTLREINRCLPSAYALGIIEPEGGSKIGDPNEIRLGKDDSLLLLSEDDDRVLFTSPYTAAHTAPVMAYQSEPVTVLIIDVNTKLPMILEEMKHYVSEGSAIYLAAGKEQMDDLNLDSLKAELSAADITMSVCGDHPVSDYEMLRQLLDQCRPAHVMVLSDRRLEEDEADEKSLTLLLYLQQYQRETPENTFGITCEMRKISNQVLAQKTVPSDFIIGHNIASLMMAQIAENRELKNVFDNLLDSDGFEIYLKPAGLYLELEKELDLFTISDAVAEKGEILLGYKKENQDPVINPAKMHKGKKVTLQFGIHDKVVVLAEDSSVRS